MISINFLVMTTLCFSLIKFIGVVSETTFKRQELGSSRTIKITFNSRTNSFGELVSNISAEINSSISSNDQTSEVLHRIIDCNERRITYIQGVSIDFKIDVVSNYQLTHFQIVKPADPTPGRLYFYEKCGKNAAIIGDGRTVQKINLNDPHNAIAFTHRPLLNDEIFEVRLDKKLSKFSHSLGIGISARHPNDIEIPPQMWKTDYCWIMHNENVYTNSTVLLGKYGENLNLLEVGATVGVMRSRFGTLHFFVNGVDQGPAVSNVPTPVYGVFELWNNAAKGTIVENKSPFA